MSNDATKMTRVSIEINGNLHFPQILQGETFFLSLHNVVYVKTSLTQIKIFE